MITRSGAKAKLESRRERRIQRLQKLALTEGIATPYNLRSTMGRKGGNSSKVVAQEEGVHGDAFDEAEVQPKKLQFLADGGCSPLMETGKVCYIDL
jgi:hypothetical protein